MARPPCKQLGEAMFVHSPVQPAVGRSNGSKHPTAPAVARPPCKQLGETMFVHSPVQPTVGRHEAFVAETHNFVDQENLGRGKPQIILIINFPIQSIKEPSHQFC